MSPRPTLDPTSGKQTAGHTWVDMRLSGFFGVSVSETQSCISVRLQASSGSGLAFSGDAKAVPTVCRYPLTNIPKESFTFTAISHLALGKPQGELAT